MTKCHGKKTDYSHSYRKFVPPRKASIVLLLLLIAAILPAEEDPLFSDYPDYLYFQRYTLTEEMTLIQNDFFSFMKPTLEVGTEIVFIDRQIREETIWFKVAALQNGQSYFGWIDRDSLVLDSRQFYGEEVLEAAQASGHAPLDNSFQRAKLREYELVLGGSPLERNGFILTLNNGDTPLVFENALTTWGAHYTLWDENTESYILHVQFYEGRHFQVIQRETGDHLELIGEPRFSGDYIYSYGSFYGELPLFEIHHVTGNGYSLKYKQIIHQPTGFRLQELDTDDPRHIQLLLALPAYNLEYTINITVNGDRYQISYPEDYSPDGNLLAYALALPGKETFTIYLDGFEELNLFPVLELEDVIGTDYQFQGARWLTEKACILTFRKGWNTREFRLFLSQDSGGEENWKLIEQ